LLVRDELLVAAALDDERVVLEGTAGDAGLVSMAGAVARGAVCACDVLEPDVLGETADSALTGAIMTVAQIE